MKDLKEFDYFKAWLLFFFIGRVGGALIGLIFGSFVTAFLVAVRMKESETLLAPSLLVRHKDWHGRGGDPVSYDFKGASACFCARRNVEMCRHDVVRCHRHAAMVMSSAIENMIGAKIRYADQRIVG